MVGPGHASVVSEPELLVLRGARPWGFGSVADVLVEDGRIAEIGTIPDHGADAVDVTGCLLLPGLVEAHCHLDKTLSGLPWVPHSAGDRLTERIRNDRAVRGEFGLPRPEAVRSLLVRMVASGTSYVRTHTDVFPDAGLHGVELIRQVSEEMRDEVTVQQVAFPQHGIVSEPGTDRLLEEALSAGASAIGGLDPAGIDRDPVRHLDTVFEVAERHGAAIDIHLHDEGSLGLWELDLISERTTALALHDRVTVSHAYALGEADEATQGRVADRLAVAGVSLVTCAVYDFPVLPLKLLTKAGVAVACGHDGIRDSWGPYGSGDMLDRAMHVAYRNTFRRDEDIEIALHAATHGGARVLGLPSYGLTEGAPADIVAVPVDSAAEAVVTRPDRRLVLKNGRVVARAR